MRHVRQWAARFRRAIRAAVVAVDPGEDEEPARARDPTWWMPPRDGDLGSIPVEEAERELLDNLEEELRRDFVRACSDLAHERRQQHSPDLSMQHRAVGERRAGIDVVLDMYLLHREIQAGASGGAQADDGCGPPVRVWLDAA